MVGDLRSIKTVKQQNMVEQLVAMNRYHKKYGKVSRTIMGWRGGGVLDVVRQSVTIQLSGFTCRNNSGKIIIMVKQSNDILTISLSPTIQEALLHHQSKERRKSRSEGLPYKPPTFPKCIQIDNGSRCNKQTIPLARYCQKRILLLNYWVVLVCWPWYESIIFKMYYFSGCVIFCKYIDYILVETL